ncbi:response regulator transcription factor [Kitasatospora sp. NPDC005856]|uniref:helix-turn-helix transcriptional regulator n=1 Tax=Kitasatospora sp. NPDC005856 TaxID=3154566 RepID=UPI0033D66D93
MSTSVLASAESPFVRECLRSVINLAPDLDCFGAFPRSELAAHMASGGAQAAVYYVSENEKCADYIPFIENARSSANPIPVAVIMACATVEHHHRLLQAGAGGILSRTITTRDLVNSVRILLSGGMVFWPAAKWNALEDYLLRPPLADPTLPSFEILTSREIDVLTLIGDGFSNEKIANLLGLELGTVKDHVRAILSKLGVVNRTQAATVAIRSGRFRPCFDKPYGGIPQQYHR